MERSQYARTWELSKQLKRGRRAPDGLHPRRRRLPARGRSSATSSGPPQPPVGRRAAGLLHQRLARGLLPALRGRDGADAADGRHPGARGDRLHARRLLGAQEGLDRPRHRRPRVGRGVVRQVRLGHDRPDAGRHARPLAGRRAGAPRRGAAPPAPRRDTGAADAAANTRASPNLSLRPELQLGTRRRPDPGRRPAERRRLGFWVWALGRRSALGAWCSRVLLFLRRPRGKTPMDRAIDEVEDALRARRAAGQRPARR